MEYVTNTAKISSEGLKVLGDMAKRLDMIRVIRQ